VERVFREKPGRKLGGGLKDRPQCERCGRPVRVSSADYDREEILCVACAAEERATDIDNYELSGRWA